MSTQVESTPAMRRAVTLRDIWRKLLTMRGQLSNTLLTFIILICPELRKEAWNMLKSQGGDYAYNLADIITIDDEDIREEAWALIVTGHPEASDLIAIIERCPDYRLSALELGIRRRVFEFDDLVTIAATDGIAPAGMVAQDYAERFFKKLLTGEMIEAERATWTMPLTEDSAEQLWSRIKLDRHERSHGQTEITHLCNLVRYSPKYRRRAAMMLFRHHGQHPSGSHGWRTRLGGEDPDQFIAITICGYHHILEAENAPRARELAKLALSIARICQRPLET